ncbi:MAG: capsular biosynthesis protein [Gammaproteobacteria bacterium]|nr:capsular biosynthesis protein [Gammaproteobacteria bacterium]
MNTTKNVVLWGWHFESDLDAVNTLASTSEIKICEWFGNHKQATVSLSQIAHDYHSILNLKQSITDLPMADHDSDLRVFSGMYSRTTYGQGKSYFDLSHLYYLYLNYFSYLLKSKNVQQVWFANFPHFGPDYALYKAAKLAGIKTLLCFQSVITNRFFSVNSIEDFGLFEETNLIEENGLNNPYKKEPPHYMKYVKNKLTSCRLSLVNDLRKKYLTSNKKPFTLEGVFYKYSECKQFKKHYKSLITKSVDNNTKFVYFPLQLQPELTTSTMGKIFTDQILAIEKLRKILPDDWYIYIKENPKQTRRQRPALFFQRLMKISNIKYLDNSHSTFKLLDDCQFSACVTGTSGWEAINQGKPVLVFGQPWYLRLPGVIEYSDTTTFEQIIKNQPRKDDVDSAFYELMKKSHAGIIDPYYKPSMSDYNRETNTKYIINFLRRVIND